MTGHEYCQWLAEEVRSLSEQNFNRLEFGTCASSNHIVSCLPLSMKVGLVTVPLALFYVSNPESSLVRFAVCKKPEYVACCVGFACTLINCETDRQLPSCLCTLPSVTSSREYSRQIHEAVCGAASVEASPRHCSEPMKRECAQSRVDRFTSKAPAAARPLSTCAPPPRT